MDKRYHPGVWRSVKYTCCDAINKHAPGCAHTTPVINHNQDEDDDVYTGSFFDDGSDVYHGSSPVTEEPRRPVRLSVADINWGNVSREAPLRLKKAPVQRKIFFYITVIILSK